MYRASEGQLKIEAFEHPFGGSLDPENRWVKLSRLVPWKEVEKLYADRFPRSGRGRPAFSVRVALGSPLVEERQGYSDEEPVESIRENPYLQFFVGFREYRNELPFHPALLVDFRKRLDPLMPRINELIALSQARREDEKSGEADKDDDNPPSGGGAAPPKRDKLLLDATRAPAEVAHPTDPKPVDAAREKTEEIVDRLHAPWRGVARKPRTYRKKARRQYLAAVRKKGRDVSAIRKASKKQLNFLRRNLRHIDALSRKTPLWVLPRKLYKDLPVVSEIYRQQRRMNRTGSRRIEDRIVSVSQPHVRPVVRVKASAPVEFGAKVAISMANGLAFVDRIGRDNFPEAALLREQVESWRRLGFYPVSVHADRIYRNRENRRFCKERGIRSSGRPPGRPPSDPAATKAMAEQVRQDERDRNPLEGKFGEGKRRYGLNRIMARLPDTSSCAIALAFVVQWFGKNHAAILPKFKRLR